MSKKVFNYNELTKIEIKSNPALLERLSENLESEIEKNSKVDCSIIINQTNPTVDIVKDKKFDYLTIDKKEENGRTSISYTRYNTLVRTIHQEIVNEYIVDTNVASDETAGLICIRNHFNNKIISSRPLIHASLVEIDDKGVLIPGFSREGKTTLMVYLLQEKGAVFVNDENVILDSSSDRTLGLYVPRTPRIRFSTISESKLASVLDDIKLTRATQHLDSDAIERIINSQSYHVDAGLDFSRKSFCEFLETTSKEKTSIDMVLFPKYSPSKKIGIRELTMEEGIHNLAMSGLTKKSDTDLKELRASRITLNQENYTETRFLEVSFSSFKDLLNGGIEL